MPIPEDRRYSKEHEWALTETDGSVLVGITEFAQHELGDVVYVELPKPGDRGRSERAHGRGRIGQSRIGTLLPVTGEVIAVNDDARNAPELVNESPYDKGWLIRVKPDDPSELDSLLDAPAYASLTE